MNRVSEAPLARGIAVLLVAGLALVSASSCDDGRDAVPSSLTTVNNDGDPLPTPVAVAPTIAPNPSLTDPRPGPDFGVVTPPPVVIDLPPQPTGLMEFIQDGNIALGYRVILDGLTVRGGIADVDVQVLNITCGTDVTGVLNSSAVAQFENVLLGRGNTEVDAADFGGQPATEAGAVEDFDFSFIFPTDPTFFDDGRILFRANRTFIDAGGEPFEAPSGDDVVLVLTITDTFGQVLRLDDNEWGGPLIDDDFDDRVITGCGALSDGLPGLD